MRGTSPAGGQVSASVVSASPSGGVIAWTTGIVIPLNQLVSNAGSTYLCKAAHTAGASFDATKFDAVGAGGSGTAVINAVPFADGAGGQLWVPGSISIPGGGFRRISFQPVVSQAPTSGLRNPRLYIEHDAASTTGVRVYVYHDITPGPGDTDTQGDVAYSVGTKLDFSDLTYQGIVISRATVRAGVGDATLNYIQAGGIVKSGATYHTWVCATNAFGASMATGYVVHFTAASAAGPWTYADTALAPTPELGCLDNSTPQQVTGDLASQLGVASGTWLLAYQGYTSFTARATKIATATSLAGPWTKPGSALTSRNGWSLTLDGPELFIIDDRLLMMYTVDAGQNWLYDIVGISGANAWGLGPCLNYNANENGSNAWGRGGVYRFGSDLYCVWQARPTAGGSQYMIYAGKWVNGGITHVTYNAQFYVNGLALTNGSNNVNFPPNLPAEAFRLLALVEARETSAIGVNEYIRLDNGFTTWDWLQRLDTLNAWKSSQAWIDFTPVSTHLTATASAATAISMNVSVMGYQRLP